MSIFEITLQRKVDNEWPAIGVFSRAWDFLPIRTESRLELDVQGLLRFADPKDYGRELGKALFRDNLRDALARAQTQAREDQQPLRILLNVEAEDLKPLHWERLCAPLDGVWDFLCLNQSTPFSLYLPSLTDRRFPPIGRRDLRALLLIAGPEELDGDFGLAPFDILATIASLRQSFGAIPHDFLAAMDGSAGPPTLEALCERLTAGGYSLLHIVCHGRYSPKGDTILYLPDMHRRPITSATFIERIARLQGTRGLPHFTFLMTCESASPEAENGFGGFGQRLVRELGMPAVLAMTAPISIKTGSELAGRFYSHLFDHGEVDRALSESLAGLMGRPDATVPAIFSRLGGRPIFSDALDRPLTPSEIQYGLELLGKLVKERAPALQDEYTDLISGFRTHVAEIETLSAAARMEFSAAMASANTLSDEIADLSFNALALGRPFPTYDQRCPFRGLASFHPEDRSFFFGREDLVQRLLGRLDAHPFLALLGPSGSGKSSLVLAGLVPALAQRTPGSSEEGAFAYFTPGADPVPRLEAALVAAPDCTLVVIDQFEELFTICRDDSKRGEFIRRILSLSPARRVVLTMRADFWGECAPYPALKDEMQAHQELVAPLDPAGMRRAIEQQAATVGLRFEADLAEDILDDVQGEPGAMPLLQHALLLLWERRHGRWLRSSEYRGFGGVQQAIAHTADGIYLKLSLAEQEGMRNIFLRLTRLDEDPVPGIERRDTRRRVALDELVPAGSERSLTVELVNRLADARLVVTGVDPISGQQEVEVAHEALIRYWKRLRSWLEEDRSTLRRGERVREAAQQWQESQRDESLLVHRGSRLEDALEIADRKSYTFNQAEINYLNACKELRQRERRAQERRRRQWLVAAVSVAVIFAVLAGYGFIQAGQAKFQAGQARSQAATATNALGFADVQRAKAQAASTLAVGNAATAEAAKSTAEAEKNRAEAAEQISRAQLRVAQSRLEYEENPLLGLALAVEGWSLVPEGDAKIKDIVEKALRDISKHGRIKKLENNDIQQIFISPDETVIVIDRETESGELRRLSDGELIETLTFAVKDVTFGSGDASKYFLVRYSKTYPPELRFTSTGEKVKLSGNIENIYFSPGDSATYFVVDYLDHKGELRRSSNAQVIHTFSDQIDNNVRFSPDPEASYVWVEFAEGAHAPGEVWYTSGGEYSLFDSRVKNLILSEDMDWPYFIVQYDNTMTPTLYPMDDDGPVLKLDGGLVEGIYNSPNPSARYFLMDYANSQKGKLYHLDENDQNQNKILSDAIETVFFSPDPAAPYFWVDYANISEELRLTSNGEIADLNGEVKPSGEIENIYFFPDDFAVFVVDYENPENSSEIRYKSDGTVVPKGRKIENICRSPDNSEAFVVDYKDKPGEFWRIFAGKVERQPLKDKIKNIGPRVYSDPKTPYKLIAYQSDSGVVCPGDKLKSVETPLILEKRVENGRIFITSSGTYFWIAYPDKQREIWYAGDNFVRLVVLDSPVKDYQFIKTSDRLLVLFNDQHSYLLDLIWLRGMAGKADSLAGEELVRLACRGPLTLKRLYEEKLVADYSDFSESVVCP